MKQCPDCGTEVPADGNFCPECGTAVSDEHREATTVHSSGNNHTHEDSEEWKYPVDEPTQTGPRPADHKLLLGAVIALSVIGLFEGGAQILFADTLAEMAQEDFGIGEQISSETLVMAGSFSVGISVAVTGVTAYFYHGGTLKKRYFWVLVAAGVVGFLLAQSLFLMLLTAFGIYGLISVID
ncbi:zinc ribbon domain-containing protein [Halovenus rubra]|uniref:Zinc ribbon domain-containing protein n=2 Tax=Halovenus rubra TaxID=869890 RepID=A0ACC7E2E1_9EURY|nr:zinc ribbon domain-containing protein [Halovenus rubra]